MREFCANSIRCAPTQCGIGAPRRWHEPGRRSRDASASLAPGGRAQLPAPNQPHQKWWRGRAIASNKFNCLAGVARPAAARNCGQVGRLAGWLAHIAAGCKAWPPMTNTSRAPRPCATVPLAQSSWPAAPRLRANLMGRRGEAPSEGQARKKQAGGGSDSLRYVGGNNPITPPQARGAASVAAAAAAAARLKAAPWEPTRRDLLLPNASPRRRRTWAAESGASGPHLRAFRCARDEDARADPFGPPPRAPNELAPAPQV